MEPVDQSNALDLSAVSTTLPELPLPSYLRLSLREAIEAGVARVRASRGEALVPEDYFHLIRGLQALRDLTSEYQRLFEDLDKMLVQIVEEEHLDAVHEQDGIPTSNLTVPDGVGGDIQITRKTHNEYYVDLPQVIAALAALVSAEWAAAFVDKVTDITPHSDPEQFACAVVPRALDFLGSTAKPKVTKVRGLAHDLAARGDDKLAAVVSGAIRKNVIYDGITVKRKPAA